MHVIEWNKYLILCNQSFPDTPDYNLSVWSTPMDKAKECQRMSETRLSTCTRLEWAARPIRNKLGEINQKWKKAPCKILPHGLRMIMRKDGGSAQNYRGACQWSKGSWNHSHQALHHYAVMDQTLSAPSRTTCPRRHMYRPVLNLLAWPAMFEGREMLSMTQWTPPPKSGMKVETLCFEAVFLQSLQDNFTALRGQWVGHIP